MGNVRCEVVEASVAPHPTNDSLEIITHAKHQAVDLKGNIKDGQKVVFIPAGSVIPADLIEFLGLDASNDAQIGNVVVEPFRIDSVISDGLYMPAEENWPIGADVTDIIGVKKHMPKLPLYLDAPLSNEDYSDLNFDYAVRDFRDFIAPFDPLEEVVVTEKLYGSPMVIGALPNRVSGKRLFASTPFALSQGKAFDLNQTNSRTIFMQVLQRHNLLEKLYRFLMESQFPVVMIGQVVSGKFGIMNYGLGTEESDFYVFDMARLKDNGEWEFGDFDILEMACEDAGFKMAPVLYVGPYVGELQDLLEDGKETLSGHALHRRHGFVIKPTVERKNDQRERAIYALESRDFLRGE